MTKKILEIAVTALLALAALFCIIDAYKIALLCSAIANGCLLSLTEDKL